MDLWDINELSIVLPISDILACPDKSWNKGCISKNQSLLIGNMDRIDKMLNVKGKWDWHYISQYIPLYEIYRNLHLPWDRRGLSMNEAVHLEHVLELDRIASSMQGKWCVSTFGRKEYIGSILKKSFLKFDKIDLSYNRTLTLDNIYQFDRSNSTGSWNWNRISRHIPITDEDPSLDRDGLSYNQSLTMDDFYRINKNHDIKGKWNMVAIGQNMNVSEIILDEDININRKDLSQNGTLRIASMNILDKRLGIVGKWDWYHISRNASISDILSNPDKPWDRDGLSWNRMIRIGDMARIDKMPNITGKWDWFNISTWIPMYEVYSNTRIQWDKKGLSRNRDISICIIKLLEK